jgi:thiol-disulfide isomerase/thioredoxin
MPQKKRKGSRRGRRGLFVVLGFVIVVVAFAVYLAIQPASTPSPAFTLPGVDANGLTGGQVSLSSFKGRVVLLEFMEPWCTHCQADAPILQSLYKKYNGSVVFLSVSGPFQGASVNSTSAFIRTYGTNWTFVFDASGSAFSAYNVQSTPYYFFLKPDGTVAKSANEQLTSSQIQDGINAAGG